MTAGEQSWVLLAWEWSCQGPNAWSHTNGKAFLWCKFDSVCRKAQHRFLFPDDWSLRLLPYRDLGYQLLCICVCPFVHFPVALVRSIPKPWRSQQTPFLSFIWFFSSFFPDHGSHGCQRLHDHHLTGKVLVETNYVMAEKHHSWGNEYTRTCSIQIT